MTLKGLLPDTTSSIYSLMLVFLGLEIIHFKSVDSVWPSSNLANFHLLGLFQNPENSSETNRSIIQSQAMFRTALILAEKYNWSINGQYIGWQIMKTEGNIINTISETCRAVSTSRILGVVGPALSREAGIVAGFAEKIGIPVVSFGATDPDLSDRDAYPNFYRTVPSDEAAAVALVKLFKRFNWTSAMIIYQNDHFGYGGAKAVTQEFFKNGLSIKRKIRYNIVIRKIGDDFKKMLTNSSSRIVIVWAESIHTSIIVKDAIDNDVLAPHFMWILINTIPLNIFSPNVNPSLIGILCMEPAIAEKVHKPINFTLLTEAHNIWRRYEPETFPESKEIDQYGLFTFDATWLLIQALHQHCPNENNSLKSCQSSINTSFCFDYRFKDTQDLLSIITNTKFLGVSGPIEFMGDRTDRVDGSYYVIYNIQPSGNSIDYVPIFKWIDHEWSAYSRGSLIVWPGNSLTPPTGNAKLFGVVLKIGMIESHPFTIRSSIIDEFGHTTPKLIGYGPDLVALLQNRIGFIPEIILAPSNQTYAGLINGVVEGAYDVVIGDVTINAARRELVGFSTSIFDNALRIIIRKNTAEAVDFLSYLRPFSFGLWLLLFITCIYAAFLICLLERSENEALESKSLISASFMSLWYSIGTILGYGADFHARTAAGRLITLGLYFLSLVLVATYTANLASDLTLSKSKYFISSIDDIKNGKVPFNRIGVRVGTSTEEYYIREISGGNRNFYPIRSRQEMFDGLLNGVIDVSFIDTGAGEYFTNNIYCNLTLLTADFDKGGFGIVTLKDWIYEKDLDVHILSLREAGLLEELRKKWFQASSCPDTSATAVAVAVETMSGLFLTFAIITALSLILFIWKKRLSARDWLLKIMSRKIFSLETNDSVITLSSVSKST